MWLCVVHIPLQHKSANPDISSLGEQQSPLILPLVSILCQLNWQQTALLQMFDFNINSPMLLKITCIKIWIFFLPLHLWVKKLKFPH